MTRDSGFRAMPGFLLVPLIFCAPIGNALAQSFTIVHTFVGGADGVDPGTGVTRDSAGNLYGTTFSGGGTGCGNAGCGTVYKIAPDSTETVLYAFGGGTDGSNPNSPPVIDQNGNLYGTIAQSGNTKCKHWRKVGPYCGAIFKLTPQGGETVLHTFEGGKDGSGPGELLLDGAGDIFGVTGGGGDAKCNKPYGCGTVFEIPNGGEKIVLYSFHGKKDGAFPTGGLVADGDGNLYGTTQAGGGRGNCTTGGVEDSGCGTVFKIAPDAKVSVLHAFSGGRDGEAPVGGLIIDNTGALYGTTTYGGAQCPNESVGCGVVFKIAANGHEDVLYAFKGGTDGAAPYAGLIADSERNLYGLTTLGGNDNCEYGCGTIFELASGTTEKVLYTFTGGSNGRIPEGNLVMDGTGDLYGATVAGGDEGCNSGTGCGIVFELAH